MGDSQFWLMVGQRGEGKTLSASCIAEMLRDHLRRTKRYGCDSCYQSGRPDEECEHLRENGLPEWTQFQRVLANYEIKSVNAEGPLALIMDRGDDESAKSTPLLPCGPTILKEIMYGFPAWADGAFLFVDEIGEVASNLRAMGAEAVDLGAFLVQVRKLNINLFACTQRLGALPRNVSWQIDMYLKPRDLSLWDDYGGSVWIDQFDYGGNIIPPEVWAAKYSRRQIDFSNPDDSKRLVGLRSQFGNYNTRSFIVPHFFDEDRRQAIMQNREQAEQRRRQYESLQTRRRDG